MATIRAPFNFVPLSKDVFFPNWANQISQDIPFSDGMSGAIELKITAESPIFVRNGHTKKDAEDKDETYKSFSKMDDGRYFIPATSIKGAIRNVLEIMSFSKMSHIDNKRFSIRDLQLKKYLNYFQNTNIHCGWMSRIGDKIVITDNDIPRRISHEDIDQKLGTDFCYKFSDRDYLKDDSHRTAAHKYGLLKTKQMEYRFRELRLNKNNVEDNRIKVVFDDSGFNGEIIFTGQPGYRKEAQKGEDGSIIKKAQGKTYEFVFKDEIVNQYELDAEADNGIYQDFCFIYKDSTDWKYWQKIMNKGGRVPVFFSLMDGKLIHFGLSYLYKLPFEKKIKGYLYDKHNRSDKDLSECIFGYTSNNSKDSSLKGRVQFSNAFCISGKPSKFMMDPYMGGPKPTYYPMYLKQNGTGGYMKDDNGKGVFFKTMLDDDAIIRGWKRYPIRSDYQDSFDVPEGQEENTNPFYPMNKGSEFKCTVRFFNLKDVEVGALLNSIDLPTGCFHNIGFAKAFGFGKIKIEIIKFESISNSDLNTLNIPDLKQKFVDLMNCNIDNYSKTIQIKELKQMCRVQKELKSKMEYMDLKEFVDCKKQHFKQDRNFAFGEYLPNYSDLIVREETPDVQVVAKAVVSFFDRNTKLAHLTSGKDISKKELDMAGKMIKLKIGDSIEVEIIKKGGNISKLKFIKK
jgi:CRISPR-associated protein (TIGR03986 family)